MCRSTCVQEIDELCEDWQPEPLFSHLTEAQKAYEPPVVSRCAAGKSLASLYVCCHMLRHDREEKEAGDGALGQPCVSCFRRKAAKHPWRMSYWLNIHTDAAKILDQLCSAPGVMVTVNGKKALNMVSSNFLGVAGDPKIQVTHKA